MIELPIGLVMRISDLLADIAKMKPGFEIYETAKQLSKDMYQTVAPQLEKKPHV